MTSISPNHLQEAHGSFVEAAKPFGGLVQAEVPRPSFHKFQEWAITNRYTTVSGSSILVPLVPSLPGFAGLMAIVLVPRQGQRPARIPGIVLEDSMRVGVLAGHETVSSLAQSLLSTVYLNNRANVLDHPNGNKLAGFGGHAVIAASALASRRDVHSAVHEFNTRSFGTEVTRQGLQDIHIGQQTVQVRAGVLALNRVGLEVASHYQPPTGDMFGSGLSGEAGNVALTLAATMSNPDAGSVNLGRAFAEMSR